MGFYDPIRILQHREELEKVEGGKAGECIPIHVRIEPTELCNFRCSFCWWHNRKNREALTSFRFTGRESLDRHRMLSLMEELTQLGTRAVSFTGAGDPLMYPPIGEVLDKAHELGLIFGVTSNLAMKIQDDVVRALAKGRWLRWSMNAGTRRTYLRVSNPKGGDPERVFDRVRENVQRIHGARVKGPGGLSLNASYVVSRSNQKDILPGVNLAKSLGADSIAFRPETPLHRQAIPNAYPEEVLRDIRIAQDTMQTEGFRVYLDTVREEDAQAFGDPEMICYYSNHTTHIDAHGDVYPCCYTRYHSRYVMGNIIGQGLNRFWFSPHRQAFYKRLIQDLCPACAYGRFNKALKPLYKGEVRAEEVLDEVEQRDYFI